MEDLLRAGAIFDALDLPCSPEAEVMREAWRGTQDGLERLLRLSVSGRELVDRGFSGDVDLAAEHDASRSVPVFSDDAFRAA